MAAAVLCSCVTGCSSGSSAATDDAGQAAAASAIEDMQQGYPVVERDDVLATEFVTDFRTRFSALASDRSDKGIANDGARICNYIVEKDIKAETVLSRMTSALTRDAPPDEATVRKVMRLGVKDICPDRVAEYKTLMA